MNEENASDIRSAEGKGESQPWKDRPAVIVGLAVLAAAAIVAGSALGAALSGLFQLDDSKKEFLRHERIVAHAKFVESLLSFEAKYQEAGDFLAAVPGNEVSDPRATNRALYNGLAQRLEDIRRSKAAVDVLGLETTRSAAVDAIDFYGDSKGEMQDDLDAALAKSPLKHGKHSEELEQLEKMRDPFTTAAKAELEIVD